MMVGVGAFAVSRLPPRPLEAVYLAIQLLAVRGRRPSHVPEEFPGVSECG